MNIEIRNYYSEPYIIDIPPSVKNKIPKRVTHTQTVVDKNGKTKTIKHYKYC